MEVLQLFENKGTEDEKKLNKTRCVLKCPRSLQVAPKMGVESVSVE